MKKLVATCLVFAMLSIAPERPKAQLAPCVLMVCCGVIAGAIVIWVYKTNTAARLRWLVLEKSHFDGNWQPVATNQVFVTAYLAKALPAFHDKMTDDTASYRVREIQAPF